MIYAEIDLVSDSLTNVNIKLETTNIIVTIL